MKAARLHVHARRRACSSPLAHICCVIVLKCHVERNVCVGIGNVLDEDGGGKGTTPLRNILLGFDWQLCDCERRETKPSMNLTNSSYTTGCFNVYNVEPLQAASSAMYLPLAYLINFIYIEYINLYKYIM